MPIFDVELSNGRKVSLEAANQPSEEQILSALKDYKPEPEQGAVMSALSGAWKGMETAAGGIAKGLAIANQSIQIRGTTQETQGQFYDRLQDDPLFKAGKVAEEAGHLTPEQQASKLARGAYMLGASVPMALGIGAIPAFSLGAIGGSIDEDYKKAHDENPNISHDDAAEIALDRSINKGVITAAVFTAMPPVVRAALEKHIVARYGKGMFNRWAYGRLSAGVEGMALGTTQAAGEQAVEGERPNMETLKGGAGMAAFNVLMTPWLRYGKGLHVEPKSEKGTSLDAVVNATPPIDLKKPSLFTHVYDEESKKWYVIAPDGNIVGGPRATESDAKSAAYIENSRAKEAREKADAEKSKTSEPAAPATPPTIKGLSSDLQTLHDEAVSEGKHDTQIVDGATDPNNNEPFAKLLRDESGDSQSVATVDPETGKILLNGDLYPHWLEEKRLAGYSKAEIKGLIKNLLNHEKIHLHTSDAAALRYWNNLTFLEKIISIRRNEFGWRKSGDVSDQMRGHEAVRFRIQQLSGMTPWEMVDATSVKERFTLKSLTALESVVRGVRENVLKTDASKEQLAILDRVLDNIKVGKVVIGSGSTPKASTKEEQKKAFEHYIATTQKDADAAIAAGNKELASEKLGQVDSLKRGLAGLDEISMPAASTQMSLADSGSDPRRRASEEAFARFKAAATTMRSGSDEANAVMLRKNREAEIRNANQDVGQRPFARTKDKSKWGQDQQSGFGFQNLGPISAKKHAEAVSGEQRLAPEGATLPPLSAVQLDNHADSWIKQEQSRIASEQKSGYSKPPSFTEFADYMRGKQPGIKNGQLGEMWQRTVADHLSNASGEEIQSMLKAAFDTQATKGKEAVKAVREERKQTGEIGDLLVKPEAEVVGRASKESIWGKMKIPDKSDPAEFEKVAKAEIAALKPKIGQADIPAELQLEGEVVGGKTQAEMAKEKQAKKVALSERVKEANDIRREIEEVKNLQRRRNKAIAVLYKKLVSPMKDLAKLERKSVTPDDIRYGGGKLIGGYEEFRAGSEEDPHIGEQLVDQHRTKEDAPGVTKRVTVLMDKNSGAVHLVSTYAGKEGEVRMADPGMAGKESATMDTIFKRYRLLASMLLDSPVRKFNQKFESIEDFNERFGKDAKPQEVTHETYQPPSIKDFLKESDATEGLPTSSVMGPKRRAFDIAAGLSDGSIAEARKAGITQPEMAGLFEFILKQQGKVESVDDVVEAMKSLKDEVKKPGQSSRSAVTALSKLGKQAEQKYSEWAKNAKNELVNQGFKDRVGEIADKLTDDELMKSVAGRIFDEMSKPVEQPKTGTQSQPSQQKRGAIFLSQSRKFQRTPTPEMPKPEPPRMLTKEESDRILNAPQLDAKGEPMPPFTPGEGWVGVEISDVLSKAKESARPGDVTRVKEYGKRQPGLTERLLKEKSPMASTKWKALEAARGATEDEFIKRVGQLKGAAGRRQTQRNMKMDAEGAQNYATMFAEQVRQGLRLVSEAISGPGTAKDKSIVRSAPLSLIAAGGFDEIPTGKTIKIADSKGNMVDTPATKKVFRYSRERVVDQIDLAKRGQAKAQELLKSERLADMRIGKKWLAAAEHLEKVAQHVLDVMPSNPNERELDWSKAWTEIHDTTTSVKEELYNQWHREREAGISTTDFGEDYLPGLYEGELFDMNSVNFGKDSLLGNRYTGKKTFRNYFEAIATAPFIPKSYDAADITGHRVRAGMMGIARPSWTEMYKDIKDPNTNKAIMMDAVPKNPHMTTDENGNKHMSHDGWSAPSTEYALVTLSEGAKPIAVLKGYESTARNMWARSSIGDSPIGASALYLSSMLKHGAILVGDTFHPARLFQYSVAQTGLKPGRKGAHSALNYRPEDLQEAVRQGKISKKSADWAREKVSIRDKFGNVQVVTKHDLLGQMVKKGLNASKIGDALYKDAVEKIPLVGNLLYHGVNVGGQELSVGRFNKWVFGEFVPGLIGENAVHSFERLHSKNPDVPADRLMRDVITDMNVYYGNLGKQGVFANPFMRDLAQITFLAPMWQEGLIGKELRTYGRLTGISNLTGRKGLPQMGALGGAVLRGLAGYFVLTQLMNLISRRQLTFQNKERGHALDAWFPTDSKGGGFWISPLSVFAEKTHDVIRLSETKPKVWDAIKQMGENALGPVGKMAVVFLTSRSPRGEYLTTTGGVIKEAASQLAPVPISFGKPMQYIGSKMGLTSAPEPGAMTRQLMASGLGVKTETAKDATSQMQVMASRFVQENGLKSESVVILPTDEPSYAKLRHAVKIGDSHSAKSIIEDLRKTHNDNQIVQAMSMWARRPFTGSVKAERLWLHSMNDQQIADYTQAVEDKHAKLEAFIQWYISNSATESH